MASGSEPERDGAFTLDGSIIISPILSSGSGSKAPPITSFVTGHFDRSDGPQPSSVSGNGRFSSYNEQINLKLWRNSRLYQTLPTEACTAFAQTAPSTDWLGVD